jgi:hypothetical protein
MFIRANHTNNPTLFLCLKLFQDQFSITLSPETNKRKSQFNFEVKMMLFPVLVQSFHYDNCAMAMITLFAVQTSEGWIA